MNRLLSVLFTLFLLSNFLIGKAYAQAVEPNCQAFRITNNPLDSTDTYIQLEYAGNQAASGGRFSFLYEYPEGAGRSDVFGGEVNKSHRFDFSLEQLRRGPGTVSIIPFTAGLGDDRRYCSIVLRYNSETQEVDITYSGTRTSSFEICNQAGAEGSLTRQKCQDCFSIQEGIWTAVGCIPYAQTTQTVRSLMTVGLGVSGGVVVLMSLYGGFLMSSSQGDPKRVDEAKSAISSAIFGLLFVIFSVAILRFIGVNILRLPDFG